MLSGPRKKRTNPLNQNRHPNRWRVCRFQRNNGNSTASPHQGQLVSAAELTKVRSFSLVEGKPVEKEPVLVWVQTGGVGPDRWCGSRQVDLPLL